MKRTAPTLLFASLVMFYGSVAAQSGAQRSEIRLPPETVKLRPPRLPGFEVASQKCAICHSADDIA